MQQQEQQQVWTTLKSDIASETAVLLSGPPKPLLEYPPKRTTFYMLLSRRKSTKCVWSPFCGFCGGIPRFGQNLCRAKKSAAEPRYMTFDAQNLLLNKDTWLCALTFGICGGEYSSGLTSQIVDTKIVI